jgi:hypothetical protein
MKAEHAAWTLYADPIDDHEIRHPNHYCWSILLSLLDVVAIIWSSPLLRSRGNTICVLCFLREAEQIARTSLHCELWDIFGPCSYIILLWKHGTEVHRIHTICLSREEGRSITEQSRAQPVVSWFLGLVPLHNLCRLGCQPDIYVQNIPSVVELDVSLCPKPKRATGLSRSHKISIVRRCFNVSPRSTYAIDCPMLKRINNSLGYRKSGSLVAQMSRC